MKCEICNKKEATQSFTGFKGKKINLCDRNECSFTAKIKCLKITRLCNLKGLNKEIQCQVQNHNCDECLKASIHWPKFKQGTIKRAHN